MPNSPTSDDAQPRRHPASSGPDSDLQAELDLLATGRDLLERLCGSPRWRYLYPSGPNVALLLESYQEFDRLRAVGRVRGGPWRQRRAFKALLRTRIRADVVDRSRRLSYRYPLPRLEALPPPPPTVQRALQRVDPDVRPAVTQHVTAGAPVEQLQQHEGGPRGLTQFRDALVNEALAHPEALVSLHPQYLRLLTAELPTKRHHPIASMLLVRLPLQLLLLFITVFNGAYLGAYLWFNDEVLGRFVSERVSGLLEGELQMGSIHWDGSLIFDLLTGTPHNVVVKDVEVWEPYKSLGKERMRRAAYAERIEATLVLHEIIPWNRLGIPTLFEIPWVLHLAEVRIEEPIQLWIREYDEVDEQGNEVRLLGLRDAFVLYEELAPDKKGLSIAVDDAQLDDALIEVDFTETGQWAAKLRLDEAAFNLAFDAPDPDFPRPMELPFTFEVTGADGVGSISIEDLEVPVSDVDVHRLASNRADVVAGDVAFDLTASAAGSPFDMEGMLHDVFPRRFDPDPQPPTTIEGRGYSPDVGGLVQHLVAQWELPPNTAVGESASARVAIHGPLADPVFELDFDGIGLDLIDEPAWAADDLVLAVDIIRQPVPEPWRGDVDPGTVRRVMHIEKLEGAALDGTIELADAEDRQAMVVMPEDGEPWRVRLPLRFEGVNPGQLAVENPELSDRLRGTASGGIWVRDLVAGGGEPVSPIAAAEEEPSGLQRLDMQLQNVKVVRDRGPRDDGLPRRLGVDGGVRIDEDGNIVLDDVELRTDGTRVRLDGRLEDDLQRLRNLMLDVDITDGPAMARAFDMKPYFERLETRLVFSGPTRAPSAPAGPLTIRGLDKAGNIEDATVWMDDGVLHVRADDVRIFGGRGDIALEAEIFGPDGGLSSDPAVHATVDLEQVDLSALGAPMAGIGDIEIEVGDGNGGRARLSQVRVRGTGAANRLELGGSEYRDASVAFDLTPEEVSIARLVLPIHRPVSPLHAPAVTVEVGRLEAEGTLGLEDDPALDLLVRAQGVPLDSVARLLDLEAPVQGQIAKGTELTVGGTMEQPHVEGRVALAGLVAGNVLLGSGVLDVTSDDFEPVGPLAAHREVRVRGSLATDADTPSRDAVRWTLDAVAAIGRSEGEADTPPVSAQVDVTFDKLAIASLLRDPLAKKPAPVVGVLDDLSAHVLRCSDGAPMLSDCVGPDNEGKLSIQLHLDKAWVRSASHPLAKGVAPCSDPDTLCSANALSANIDWPSVELARPWRLESGGPKKHAKLELSGTFDFSEPADNGADEEVAAACRAPSAKGGTEVRLSSGGQAGGQGEAKLRGTLDVEAIAGLLQPYGVEEAQGHVALDVSMEGFALDPRIGGTIALAPEEDAFVLRTEAVPHPLRFTDLILRLRSGWIAAAGNLDVVGTSIDFGSFDGANTGYALSGACQGTFEVAAQGALGSRLLADLLGDVVKSGGGGVGLPRLHVLGRVRDEVELLGLQGQLAFEEHDLGLEFTEGLTSVELDRGIVDFRRCMRGECEGVPTGWYALWLGGRKHADNDKQPSTAVRMMAGTRGRAWAWGSAYLSPDFQRANRTAVHVRLDDLPIRTFDDRGNPVVEAELTSKDVALTGGAPLVLTADIAVDRARYVKDAVQGVEILALTEAVETVESPPPALLQGLQLDLKVETERPLRVENNVASGVQADLVVDVTGTYEDPEVTGRFEVEPGGAVDIPFLTGTYEIQRGRVTLLRRIEDAEVDVLALRREPVYIGGQARQIQLMLGGTLSAIRWSCLSDGSEVSGELDTVRGCTEYLVLGTGDVDVSDTDVQRYGGGGLANARKPLQVVGHLTELDVGERIAEAAPRVKTYVPDARLRLGQIGPELEVGTPPSWWDWDWGRANLGWDYTRGYPGFLLRQSRELKLRLEILDPMSIEYSRRSRDYLNERIVFDPLEQRVLELQFDFEIPSL